MTRATLLTTVFLVLCGCELVPEVGPPIAERCVDEDSDPSTTVSFRTDVVELVKLRCLPCHDPNGEGNVGFLVGGLDLTSYAGVLQGGVNGGAAIVVSGKPCDSVIVQKTSAGPPFGNRMPFDGPPFLDEAEARLVRDWIAEGAVEN